MAGASCNRISALGRAGDGVRLAVRVRPGAGPDRIEGLEASADGQLRLKLRVAAPAAGGKANAAAAKLLAKAWRLPASDIRVVRGAKARNKLLAVKGDPVLLYRRLDAWLRRL